MAHLQLSFDSRPTFRIDALRTKPYGLEVGPFTGMRRSSDQVPLHSLGFALLYNDKSIRATAQSVARLPAATFCETARSINLLL